MLKLLDRTVSALIGLVAVALLVTAFGQVIDDISEVGPALDRAAELQPEYEPVQREWLTKSMDLSPVPASVRHADAILHFARNGRFS